MPEHPIELVDFTIHCHVALTEEKRLKLTMMLMEHPRVDLVYLHEFLGDYIVTGGQMVNID